MSKPEICDTKLRWCSRCKKYRMQDMWTESEHRHDYQIYECEACHHLDLERIEKVKKIEED